MVLDEQELNEKIMQVEVKEKELDDREATLRDVAVDIERQKEANYQREHQILIAE